MNTLNSFIGKLDMLEHVFQQGLPMENKKRLAKKFLLWTLQNPGPPVDTGRLRSSGSAWVGSSRVAGGGDPGDAKPKKPINVITITYSAPKQTTAAAKHGYHFNGTRWFDYADYQHIRHATNKLWTAVLLTKGVAGAIGREVQREMRRIWSS